MIHDTIADTWTCSGAWCGRAKWCRHRQRARTLALARFWESLLSNCSPAELRAMFPAKQQQLDHDIDALSAWAAIVVIDCLLAAADEPLVAAA